MNIAPYITENWITIESDFQILQGLLTKNQSIKLQALYSQAQSKAIEMGYKVTVEGAEYPDLSRTEEFIEYIYLNIQYKVKEWKGLKTGKDELPCEMDGDKLADKTMEWLYNVPGFALKIYHKIQEKSLFKNTDKKK